MVRALLNSSENGNVLKIVETFSFLSLEGLNDCFHEALFLFLLVLRKSVKKGIRLGGINPTKPSLSNNDNSFFGSILIILHQCTPGLFSLLVFEITNG